MRRTKKVVISVCGLGVAYVGASYGLAIRFVSPPQSRIEKPESVLSHKLGLGTVWTSGPPSTGETVFVFAHGYRGDLRHWVPAMVDLAKQGVASVTFPLPGHALSSNPTCSLGPNEANALLETCRWVRATYRPKRLIAVGVSLGGATCWLAAEKDPSFADAIITESAFAHLDDAVAARFGPFFRVVLSPMIWMAQVRAGITVSNVNPLAGAHRWKGKEALIFHVKNDVTVPNSQGKLLAAALGTEVLELEGDHSTGYRNNRARYLSAFVRLIR